MGKTESPPFKKSITLCQGAAIFRSLFGGGTLGSAQTRQENFLKKVFLELSKTFELKDFSGVFRGFYETAKSDRSTAISGIDGRAIIDYNIDIQQE
ncbi:MAG: hypothetical protein KIG76_02360 [Eubacteriales bacterium]|nr:hypothetical protein [Candidatus Colimorpha enterica]